MRHMKNSVKLGRTAEARKALLSSLAVSFIEEQRITTTLQKAKMTRVLAERLVTTAKRALASGKPEALMVAKRKALSVLRKRTTMNKLFEAIAPQFKDRQGGYTRIVKLGQRGGDGAEMVVLEWVNLAHVDKSRKAKKEEASADSKGEGKRKDV